MSSRATPPPVPHEAGLAPYLAPGEYIDSDHPRVRAYAERAIAGAEGDPIAAAVRLYYAVRDDILYDPYVAWGRPETYRASACLEAGRGFCVPKASLLAACGRAAGIPTRIAFADVRNHLTTPRLRRYMGGSDVFTYHGITELHLGGRWVKATPTFNLSLCRRFGVVPLDFDGYHDALFHPYDRAGRRHMEYLRYRGAFADVPYREVSAAMYAAYPGLYAGDEGASGVGGDFSAEAGTTET